MQHYDDHDTHTLTAAFIIVLNCLNSKVKFNLFRFINTQSLFIYLYSFRLINLINDLIARLRRVSVVLLEVSCIGCLGIFASIYAQCWNVGRNVSTSGISS